MIEIKEKQELNVTNLLSFRGKVSQAELEAISRDMHDTIARGGAKTVGSVVTATYDVEGETIDMEILVPIDRPVDSVGRYEYKERLLIVNAVMIEYKGHPEGLQDAMEQLNQYIIDNHMQPITVGYNVTKRNDSLVQESVELEVYVGINPNIL